MKAIVVGAGFAGLAAAARLADAGVEVEVFEARDRVGGRVWSVPFAGGVVERGAEFILPGNDTVVATAERLGLALVRKGTQYGDREPRGRDGIDTVSPEQVARAAARIASKPPAAGTPVATLAQALATYRLDPAVAEAIRARIEVSCGYPAGDLDASVLREAGAAFGPFETYTVQGGNDRIARELAARLGESVHVASPVRRIAWDERGVRIRAGSHVAVADAAVVAVPAATVGAISFDPPLPDGKARAIVGVRYGQAAKMFVRLGSLVPPSATLSVPGRFWCWTQLGADGAPAPFLAAFAGTAAALDELSVRSGANRWLAALRSLRPDLALDAGDTLLSTWEDDPWARAAYSAQSAASPIDTGALTRPVGPLAFAGEHTAGEWHAQMEGALRSGERAAQQLLRSAGR
ncbi:MAG TPA: NAD(P)/FAD-dependent oxidoreductase [Solirubrobacteraceae bacterium]|nr:NAD(P)/FAD-dependent oxidoreductase [Solirubrobacteraceae bacterium]